MDSLQWLPYISRWCVKAKWVEWEWLWAGNSQRNGCGYTETSSGRSGGLLGSCNYQPRPNSARHYQQINMQQLSHSIPQICSVSRKPIQGHSENSPHHRLSFQLQYYRYYERHSTGWLGLQINLSNETQYMQHPNLNLIWMLHQVKKWLLRCQ